MPAGRKRQRMPTECAICAKPCRFHFYGVPCCAGCKHFFHREIRRQQQRGEEDDQPLLLCKWGANCDLKRGSRCQYCRLAKCLELGMRADRVGGNADTNSIAQNAEENAKLTNCSSSSSHKIASQTSSSIVHRELMIAQKNMQEAQFISELLKIGSIVKRIRRSSSLISDEYFERHNNFQLLLESGENLLARSEQFSSDLHFYDRSKILGYIKCNGIFGKHQMALANKNFVLCILLAKILPGVKKIPIEDQVALVREMTCAASLFFLSYCSARDNCSALSASDGRIIFECYMTGAQRYSSSANIIVESARKILVDPIDAHLKLKLDKVEFMLLVAMLYSNSACTGLSQAAQQILREEEAKYGRMLLGWQQRQWGPSEGALRHMQSLQLVWAAIGQAQKFRELNVFVDSVHERGRLAEAVPSLLVPIIS